MTYDLLLMQDLIKWPIYTKVKKNKIAKLLDKKNIGEKICDCGLCKEF